MTVTAAEVTSWGDEVSEIGALYDLLWRRPAWQADALCREHPEVNFFPRLGEPVDPALQVCEGCLVRYECRQWALAQGPTLNGVWGGLSQQQRQRITHRSGRIN